MDKEEIKRRFNRRIDEDDKFAGNVKTALDTEDTVWLLRLIREVIGVIIEIVGPIWEWITGLF
jgi:hypothetical protein